MPKTQLTTAQSELEARIKQMEAKKAKIERAFETEIAAIREQGSGDTLTRGMRSRLNALEAWLRSRDTSRISRNQILGVLSTDRARTPEEVTKILQMDVGAARQALGRLAKAYPHRVKCRRREDEPNKPYEYFLI
jgi:acetyl-CoA carboxylase alpha subunit